MAADIAKRRLGPREKDELEKLLDDMKGAGQVVVKETVVRGIPMAMTAEYEVERRVRQELMRDVAVWADIDYFSLPSNPELAWDQLRNAVEAGPKMIGEHLNQLERARDVLTNLQESLAEEYGGQESIEHVIGGLVPALNEDGSGIEQEEIDKLKKLTAGLIKLAEECYDVLREK